MKEKFIQLSVQLERLYINWFLQFVMNTRMSWKNLRISFEFFSPRIGRNARWDFREFFTRYCEQPITDECVRLIHLLQFGFGSLLIGTD